LAGGPFDDQPLLAWRQLVVRDGVRGDDTNEGEAAADLLAGWGRAAGQDLQASAGSRSASARSDSGLRSGRGTLGGRPRSRRRCGTAKLVSGLKTPTLAETATRYSSPR